MLIQMQAPSVRYALTAARRYFNITANDGHVVSGGEDGLYRISWPTGHVAEVTIVLRRPVKIVSASS